MEAAKIDWTSVAPPRDGKGRSMSQLATLDELGLKHGTDKASNGHGYLEFYESYFSPLRNNPISVLELGVYNGASLKTWEDYFPRAEIIGVDILPSCKRLERDRVKIELADQSNVEHLTRVALAHGPFDIIIEDGSHLWDHQITSLRTLFPFLKDNGLYIVEDLQTNYGAMQAKYKGAATSTCVDFLKSWLDLCVADDVIDIRAVEDSFLRTYGRALEFITFHRRASILKKKIPPVDWRLNAGPPVASDAATGPAASINVMAHVGMKGDIFGPSGYVDLGSDRFTIQGFTIDAEENALEYRVRFPDQSWSDWTPSGRFAGTRGKALPVTGFTIRLREGASGKFGLRAFGRFVEEETPVEVANGRDCVSASGRALRGIQVELVRRVG
jgi:hypothetical protein